MKKLFYALFLVLLVPAIAYASNCDDITAGMNLAWLWLVLLLVLIALLVKLIIKEIIHYVKKTSELKKILKIILLTILLALLIFLAYNDIRMISTVLSVPRITCYLMYPSYESILESFVALIPGLFVVCILLIMISIKKEITHSSQNSVLRKNLKIILLTILLALLIFLEYNNFRMISNWNPFCMLMTISLMLLMAGLLLVFILLILWVFILLIMILIKKEVPHSSQNSVLRKNLKIILLTILLALLIVLAYIYYVCVFNPMANPKPHGIEEFESIKISSSAYNIVRY